MNDNIEMFQDCFVRGSYDQRPAFKAALVMSMVSPWSFNQITTDNILRNAITNAEILAFERVSIKARPAVGLTLWGTDYGFYVPNIVPSEMRELSCAQYNEALNDFCVTFLKPISDAHGFKLELSKPYQNLDDWLNHDIAQKLVVFSSCANKSSAASHPMDKRRWFDFLIACHNGDLDKFDSGKLSRWLIEAEGWEEEVALSLTAEYENAISLLRQYDNR